MRADLSRVLRGESSILEKKDEKEKAEPAFDALRTVVQTTRSYISRHNSREHVHSRLIWVVRKLYVVVVLGCRPAKLGHFTSSSPPFSSFLLSRILCTSHFKHCRIFSRSQSLRVLRSQALLGLWPLQAPDRKSLWNQETRLKRIGRSDNFLLLVSSSHLIVHWQSSKTHYKSWPASSLACHRRPIESMKSMGHHNQRGEALTRRASWKLQKWTKRGQDTNQWFVLINNLFTPQSVESTLVGFH